MLKFLRKNTHIIIWTVVLSFALWGAFSVGASFQKKGRYAGEVFGKNVTFQEYNDFYRAASIFTPKEEIAENPDILRQRAWQNLIYSRAAKKMNIEVTDDAVRKELRRILSAQNLPEITPEYYERWLKSTLKLEPTQFEKMIREMIRIQKLYSTLADEPAAQVTEEELKKAYEFTHRALSGEIIMFDAVADALSFKKTVEEGTSLETVLRDKEYEQLPFDGTLEEIARTWEILPQYSQFLFNLPENELSQPIPIHGSYGVFFITKKADVDYEALDEDARKELVRNLHEKKTQLKVIQKHYKLLQDANLKDYTQPQEKS